MLFRSYDNDSFRDEKWRYDPNTGFPAYSNRYAFKDGLKSPYHVVDAKSDEHGVYTKSYILQDNIEKFLTHRVDEPEVLHARKVNKKQVITRLRPNKNNRTDHTTRPRPTTGRPTHVPLTTTTDSPTSVLPSQIPDKQTGNLPDGQKPALDPIIYQGIIGGLQSGIFPSYYPQIIQSPDGQQNGVWSFHGFGQQSPIQGQFQQNFYLTHPPDRQAQYGSPSPTPPTVESSEPPNYFGTSKKPGKPHNRPSRTTTTSSPPTTTSYRPTYATQSSTTLPPIPITTDRPNYFGSSSKPPDTGNHQPNYNQNKPITISATDLKPIYTERPNYFSTTTVQPRPEPDPTVPTYSTGYPITIPPPRPGYLGNKPYPTNSDNSDFSNYITSSNYMPPTNQPSYIETSSAQQPPHPQPHPPTYTEPGSITHPFPPPSEAFYLAPNSTTSYIYSPIYIGSAHVGDSISINYGPQILTLPTYPLPSTRQPSPSSRHPLTAIVTTTTTQSTLYWPSTTPSPSQPPFYYPGPDPDTQFDIRYLQNSSTARAGLSKSTKSMKINNETLI